MSNGTVEVAGGVSVGQMRKKWLELMFYLSCFFGALHFAGLNGQVWGMIVHNVFHREPGFTVESSMWMAQLYIAFLAGYVLPKEYLRWFKRSDDEILSPTEHRKITRGLWIVAGWAMYTGIIVLFKQFHLITEIPETLWYTLGEVVALFCGTEASKFFRTRNAVKKQDTAIRDNFADRVIDYVKEHGSMDRTECQNEYGLSEDQAYRLLNKLKNTGRLKSTGIGKATKYILP